MNFIWSALGYKTQQDQTTAFDQQQQKSPAAVVSSQQTINSTHLPRLIIPSSSDSSVLSNKPSSLLNKYESILVPKLSHAIVNSSIVASSPETDLTAEWTLMFSTNEHGRSFPRLVSALGKVRGPTLVIIQEEDSVVEVSTPSPSTVKPDFDQQTPLEQTTQEEEAENIDRQSSSPPTAKTTQTVPGNIFGCVVATPWETVKAREMNAKAAAAAKARSARTGIALKEGTIAKTVTSKETTQNQAPQFFGTSECFIFKMEQQPNQEIKIFYPRPTSSSLSNGNFQYFFDTHPDTNSVGLGIGGNGNRSCVGVEAGMAFFVERNLTKGQACPGGCITFQYSEQLTKNQSEFKIRTLEIWALSSSSIERDYCHLLSDGAKQDLDEEKKKQLAADAAGHFSSPALGAKHSVAKAMFEMNGGTVWSENNERCEMP